MWENEQNDTDYVSKEEFKEVEEEIDKLKKEVQELKENKVSNQEWQLKLNEINNNISLLDQRLNEKFDEISLDRKEDKEMIKEMRDSMEQKINELFNTINNTNISNAKIEANQSNTVEKISDLKIDIQNVQINVQNNITNLATEIANIKYSIDNSLWNTFMRLFNKYKLVKIIAYFVVIMILFTIVSAFMYYMSNGIPWTNIKALIDFIK